MRIGRMRLEGPWGDMGLLLVFVGFTIWYFQDAYRASPAIENLLLIGPASAVALALGFFLLLRTVPRLRLTRQVAPPTGEDAKDEFRERHGPVAAIGALVAYVLAMPFIGFDVATFLFIALGMLIQGERRPLVLIVFPVLVAGLVVYALKNILFVPVPTLLMG
jgi:putative tricarboxylic transport membrane protein